jgi:phosphohistidine phosphatase
MKRLLVIRHGKAEHTASDGGDFRRKLTDAGKEESRSLGSALSAAGIRPDQLVSSAAPRALRTASIVAEALGLDIGIVSAELPLYDAEAVGILKSLREIPDSVAVLALCGHNPALTDLLRLLDPEKAAELTTASAALVTLDVLSWVEDPRGRVLRIEYFGKPPKAGS